MDRMDTVTDTAADTADLPLLRPGDPGYDGELAGFQTGFAQRPDAVVAARDAADVVAAVRYAAARDLPVRVQATGHGLPGASEGGLLISTRRMNGVRVDPAARTVRAEAGVRWKDVVAAAEPHGLAPLNGSAPSVGVVGYTLGGGLGILAREFGYAADHVRALDVVTADGRLRHVTPESAPDLYRALLGGGPGVGLGVVTALEIGLVPVTRLYGGSLAFDGREVDPAGVLRAYEAWTRTVPDSLTSSFAAVPYPDLPGLPAHLRGRYVVSVRVAHTGDDGDAIVAPLRDVGPVLADSLREMPYAESHTIHSDPDFPHAYYGEGAVLSELDVERGGELLGRTGPGAGAMCVVQVNHLGGALARPAPNAVPYRAGRFLVRLLTMGERERARELLDPAFELLAPHTLGRAVNFAFGAGDRGEGLYDADTRKRLAEVKSRYDSANLFQGA